MFKWKYKKNLYFRIFKLPNQLVAEENKQKIKNNQRSRWGELVYVSRTV